MNGRIVPADGRGGDWGEMPRHMFDTRALDKASRRALTSDQPALFLVETAPEPELGPSPAEMDGQGGLW